MKNKKWVESETGLFKLHIIASRKQIAGLSDVVTSESMILENKEQAEKLAEVLRNNFKDWTCEIEISQVKVYTDIDVNRRTELSYTVKVYK